MYVNEVFVRRTLALSPYQFHGVGEHFCRQNVKVWFPKHINALEKKQNTSSPPKIVSVHYVCIFSTCVLDR